MGFYNSLDLFPGGWQRGDQRNVANRPQILLLEGPVLSAGAISSSQGPPEYERGRGDDLTRVLELLRQGHYDGICADLSDPAVRKWAGNLLQSQRVLEGLPVGVAVLNADLHIVWANAAFETWCGCPVGGRGFFDSLAPPESVKPDSKAFRTALTGKISSTRLQCRNNRTLELHITPVRETDGKVGQLIVLGRDVTAEVNQQQKLTA